MTSDVVRFSAELLRAKALAANPEIPQAEKIDAFNRTLELCPDSIDAKIAFGIFYAGIGAHQKSIDLLLPVFDPKASNYLHAFHLGNMLSSAGRFDESAEAYRRASHLAPEDAQVLSNLGYVLSMADRHDEAILALSDSLLISPNLKIALSNMAYALERAKRYSEALVFSKRVVELDPAERYLQTLAGHYQKAGYPKEAFDTYSRVFQMNPRNSLALQQMAGFCWTFGETEKACEYFYRLYDLSDKSPGVLVNYLMMQQYREADPVEVLNIAKQETSVWCADRVVLPKRSRRVKTRAKVGIISPDLFHHPVGQLIIPVLEKLTDKKFEYQILDRGDVVDDLSRRIRDAKGIKHIDFSKVPYSNLYDHLSDQKLDLLCELSGFSGGNCLSAIANRVAPVQVNYLGFPGSTGMVNMDYRITDHYSDPVGQTEAFHSEQLYRMDGSFVFLNQPRFLPRLKSPPHSRGERVTFACFNNAAKFSETTLKMWGKILQAVPNSRLLLKARLLSDQVTRDYYLTRLSSFDLPVDRIELVPAMGFGAHMSLYQDVDICLDPFPYHGTATTIEAIWSGVPVVCLQGITHASRVGTTLLTAAGLEECLCETPDDYVEKAIFFSKNPKRVEEIRFRTRDILSKNPDSDPLAFSLKLEKAFADMLS